MKKNNYFIHCMIIFLSLITFSVILGCNGKEGKKNDDEQIAADDQYSGLGEFDYTEYAPLSSRPITVYYYKPKQLNKDSRVMLLMHGNSRAAESYRKSMISYAEENNFLLIVPKFSEEHYPVRDYHQGGVFDKEGSIKPKEEWTFSVIEPLFDYIKEKFDLEADEYILYGFSAGSQFVHRFTWFYPNNRASKIIAGSAGSYTMPDYETAYIYGLKNTGIPPRNIKEAFKKDYTVVVGQADTVLSRNDLPKSKQANLQGRDRVERAMQFYTKSKQLAQEKGWDFNWHFLIAEEVGHSQKEMAKPIAEYLFDQ